MIGWESLVRDLGLIVHVEVNLKSYCTVLIVLSALRVDWRMMNIMQEDNKIVDLITFIGDPFPKANFLVDPGSDVGQTNHLLVHSPSCEKDNSYSVAGQTSDEVTPCLKDDSEPLIRAAIKPHEGVFSCEPFDIHPRQIVRINIQCTNQMYNGKFPV